MVQRLRLHSQCRGPSLIPGQGTRTHMLYLSLHVANSHLTCHNYKSRHQLKILHAAQRSKTPRATTKTWHSQINGKKKKRSGGGGEPMSFHSKFFFFFSNKVISGDSSLSEPGLLSKLFEIVEGEIKVFLIRRALTAFSSE